MKFKVSRDKSLVKSLGGDDDFAEKVAQFFAGTRRYLEPGDAHQSESNDDDSESDDDGTADLLK